MRILVLSNLYPPRVIGGYELFCRGIVDHLRESGHEVTVLTSAGPAAEGQDHVRRRLTLYMRDGRTPQPLALLRLRRERSDNRALREIGDWDVALVFHMVGLAKSLLTQLHERGPVGYVLADLWPAFDLCTDTWLGRLHPEGPPGTPQTGVPRLRFPSYAGRAVAPLARRVGVPVDWPDMFGLGHWWANSQYTLDTLLDHYKLPLRHARVLRHGVPLERFPMRPAASAGRRLLYAGRVTPQKGIDVALAALERVPGASLDLVGHADEDYVRSLRLPERARILPPVDQERLAEVYSSHDALLFPVSWDEPLGFVPLEAMACGLPVVATGTGGSAEYLVHERNCLLVEPGDAEALAVAAERVLDDERLRERLIAGGRRTAEENSLQASGERIDAAATELAAS